MIRTPRLFALMLLSIRMFWVQASFLDGFGSPGAETSADQGERLEAMLGMARSLMTAQPAAAFEKLKGAEALAEQAGETRILLEVIRLERDLAQRTGDPDRSLKDAIRVVELGGGLHDARAHASDLVALGDAYLSTDAHGPAIDVFRKAIPIAQAAGDMATASRAMNALVEALVMAGRTAEAMKEGKAALAFQEEQGNAPGQASIWLAMGEALTNEGRHADALPHLAKAERLHRSIGSDKGLQRTMLITARALVGIGHWSQAEQCIHEVLALAGNGPELTPDPEVYHLQGRVQEAQGDVADALRSERMYTAQRDSIQAVRLKARAAGLRALYATDQRDAELKQLRQATSDQDAMIANARVRGRIWLLAFAALLIAFAGMVLLWHRLRRTHRRAAMRAEVIRRQGEEIKAKNLELERQNLRLAESLMQEEEKDVLLKEIHHRVKNNLQIVITLLRMQGHHQQDDRLEEILADCEGRVRSMALVHEHIYRVGDLRRVNVRAHLLALSEAVLKQYGLYGKVAVDLQVNYDLARFDDLIPLSLMINELLTNSAKHAFTGREEGRIAISLRKLGENQYELTFADDGVGAQQEAFFRSGSFGLELVRSLATQLDGRIRLLKGEGTTFQMTFQPEERTLRRAS